MTDEFFGTSSLLESVSKAVYKEFGDRYTIYPEAVEQGLQKPCFFIQCVKSALIRQVGDMFMRENLLCIQFFPENTSEPVRECHDASDRLMQCLEYIELEGDPLRSKGMNYEINDGVLSFFVNFDFPVRNDSKADIPRMEKIELHTRSGQTGF